MIIRHWHLTFDTPWRATAVSVRWPESGAAVARTSVPDAGSNSRGYMCQVPVPDPKPPQTCTVCQEDAECVGPQFYGLCEQVEIELLSGFFVPARACLKQW